MPRWARAAQTVVLCVFVGLALWSAYECVKRPACEADYYYGDDG